jgi:SAM-dependent MidA family methyltransferase
MMSLAEPTAAALAHSRRLARHIRAEVDRAGGWLPFSRYMELALYAPGLGYYSAGADKLGPAGDFVTAPEISPLFAVSLASQVAQVLSASGGDLLELGAGTGRLALDLMRELSALDCLPERYAILEVSPDLRQRQRSRFEQEAPDLLPRLVWLERLPERFTGQILANEVLDALPVDLLVWRDGGVEVRGVEAVAGAFAWADRPVPQGPLWQAAQALPKQVAGYLSEVNLAAGALVGSLGACLERGAILFIDYGFPRAEYYHPQRDTGTLMCHYRHRAHTDPFFLPGLEDITAHVDFTAVADAALDAGLEVLGYTSQAMFLVNCGLLARLARLEHGSLDGLRQTGAAQKLIQPTEMGELFKVLALGRGLDLSLLGFARGDRRHAL